MLGNTDAHVLKTVLLCREGGLREGCVWGEHGGLNGSKIIHLRAVNKASCPRVPGKRFAVALSSQWERAPPIRIPLTQRAQSNAYVRREKAFLSKVCKSQKIRIVFVAPPKMKSPKGGYHLQVSAHGHAHVFSVSTAASNQKGNDKGV